jgi:hypothetical protein
MRPGNGAAWATSAVAVKKSTGMIEKVNDIFQRVLSKTGEPDLFHQRMGFRIGTPERNVVQYN